MKHGKRVSWRWGTSALLVASMSLVARESDARRARESAAKAAKENAARKASEVRAADPPPSSSDDSGLESAKNGATDDVATPKSGLGAGVDKSSRRAITLDDGSDRTDEGASVLAAPNTHVVRKGDTLWDICARYFHDPWRWPKVWALNPDVENPHWIYPGQIVRLDKDDGRAMIATNSLGEPREGDVPPGAPENALPPFSPGLKEVGFVDEGGLKLAGTITGSPEEKIMLASGDAAYVSFSSPKTPLVRGKEYPVYEVDDGNPVRDPDSRKTLGYLVHVRGFARIDDATTKEPLARATLVDTTEPVERGFRVGEVFHDRLNVTPRPAVKTLRGRLAAALTPNLLIGRDSFVVLNKGRADGVEQGNVFRVVRRGDGYRDVMDNWDSDDPAFPPLTVGEIVAADVRDHTTIGWVVRSVVELRIGDAISLTEGQ